MLKLILNSNNIYLKSLIIFITTLSILSFQEYFIYPIEKFLTKSPAIDYVSILFLPHGIKIILFFIYRYIAILPIFLATYLYGFHLPLNLLHFLGSIVGILSIAFSFSICAYLLKTVSLNYLKFPLWRVLLVVTLFSSLINTTLQSAIASFTFKDFNLNLLFLFGDIVGSLTIIFIVISSRKYFIRYMSDEK